MFFSRRAMGGVALGLVAGLTACGGSSGGGAGGGGGGSGSSTGSGGHKAVHAMFDVPTSLDTLAETHFLDHPWPSDLRLENGSPRLEGYYNPKNSFVLTSY